MKRQAMRDGVITEADTCREFVTPRLVEAGWGAAPHAIGEQRTFTNGRIIVVGGKARRGKQKRADYLCTTAATIPWPWSKPRRSACLPRPACSRAREYTEILGLKFAYATNGHRIIEIDYTAGTEHEVDRYATPDELFSRLTAAAPLPHRLHESRLCGRFPIHALRLLAAIASDQPWGAPELGQCLELFVQADASLARDTSHQRLREYARRRGG